jgi:signal transduction histidine kinase
LQVVSHDLQNPVMAIRLYAELLRPDVREGPASRRLATISEITRQMEQMVRGLIDLQASAHGRLTIMQSSAELGRSIDQSLAMLQPIAAQRGIKLLRKGSTRPLELKCDGGRLLQVLSNLIGNAIKYSPEGGVVTVETRDSFPEARVRVIDFGPGIPEERLAHVFERFYRGDDGPTAGSGLGLAIVKAIVEAHGGTVAAESEVGVGSVFSFTLPRAPSVC